MNHRFCEGQSCVTHFSWKRIWNTWISFHLFGSLLAIPSSLADRTRGNGYKLQHRRLHLNSRKHFLYCEGNHSLARAAHTGCKFSHLGDNQKLSGDDPGQLQVALLEHRFEPEVPSNLNHFAICSSWPYNVKTDVEFASIVFLLFVADCTSHTLWAIPGRTVRMHQNRLL